MQKTQTKETEDPFRTNFPFRLRKLRILFGSGLDSAVSSSTRTKRNKGQLGAPIQTRAVSEKETAALVVVVTNTKKEKH